MKIRAPGIPIWITCLVIFFALLSTVAGVVALFFNHSLAIGYIEGADRLAMTWGGRNLGLGLVMVVALFLRSPATYAAAFSGAFCRELSDLLSNLAGPPNPGELTVIAVLLVLDIVAFVLSLKVALQDRAKLA